MQTAANPSWFKRNIGWVIGLGVGGGILLSLVFIFLWVFALIKSSDAYGMAMAKASTNAAVVQALGTPIESGRFVSGKINVSGPSGDAQLAIPVSGPHGAGTVYVEARKATGKWTLDTLLFEDDKTHERTDLLSPSAAPAPGISH